MYCSIGQPATVGDSAAFRRCNLKESIEKGEALPATLGRSIPGRDGSVVVQPFLVGDSAFASTPYMIRNFPGDPALGSDEHAYNYCHIRTRRVVENAFGRLKNRFRVLVHTTIRNAKWLQRIIRICCALHNICTSCNCWQDPAWFQSEEEVRENTRQRASARLQDEQHAVALRTVLAQYVKDVKGCSESHYSLCVICWLLCGLSNSCPVCHIHLIHAPLS